ncbi:hypothetical protein DH2020_021118 [Rehmannia glutinosa]|uniref:Magnesium transporter n=1 Tax=Rehmannia glutinosa TaxID=99300 RepID=A0ABR0WA26_REHGL
MASSTPLSSQYSPSLLQLPFQSTQFRLILAGISLSRSKCEFSPKLPLLQQQQQRSWDPLRPIAAKEVGIKCFAKPAEEIDSAGEVVLGKDGDDGVRDDVTVEEAIGQDFSNGSAVSQRTPTSGDSLSLGIREPVYEVVEVRSNGMVSTRKINRRHLLKSSGLRPRDVRSVDPSLWLTNSMPSLLMDTFRAYCFGQCGRNGLMSTAREGIVGLCDNNCFHADPQLGCGACTCGIVDLCDSNSLVAILERGILAYVVVEAALHSRIQRLERRLMDLEPRVQTLLEVLPNRLTGDILEELRISKQKLTLMKYDLICIMGRNCTLMKNDEVECSVPLEKEIAEEEEEEIEMLLENYLQRCESCHGQAERLLDSAKEMEDSIAVNLSSRRLEVSRVELLLQVGAFCVGVGALVAVMPSTFSFEAVLKFAFWLTTAGIFVGAVANAQVKELRLVRDRGCG